MKVLVCGGRDFSGDVAPDLERLNRERRFSKVIVGGFSGADKLAWKWATSKGIDVNVHYAQWHLYGPKAGPMRNAKMLELDKPDLVVAFPGGRGTADMVGKAKAAGVPVVEFPSQVDPTGGDR